MEEIRERTYKRLDSQYSAVVLVVAIFLVVILIMSIVTLFLPLFFILGGIILLATWSDILFYKKGRDTVKNTNPIICTVTRADTKALSWRRFQQAAFFIYEDKECFGFDWERERDQIEAGQQIYVWKVTDKHYEIAHID